MAEPRMVKAWLAARSIARGLPPPIPDCGGYRVDTGSETEWKRWVFPQVGSGLIALARTIRAPRHLLKLFGSADELRAVVPPHWRIGPPRHFMTRDGGEAREPALPSGYAIECDLGGATAHVRIRSAAGELAASGYAAETNDAFVYDRILTAPDHRRKGLGSAVMGALYQARQRLDALELLVATDEGRALYEASGWRRISPYSTASIVDA